MQHVFPVGARGTPSFARQQLEYAYDFSATNNPGYCDHDFFHAVFMVQFVAPQLAAKFD